MSQKLSVLHNSHAGKRDDLLLWNNDTDTKKEHPEQSCDPKDIMQMKKRGFQQYVSYSVNVCLSQTPFCHGRHVLVNTDQVGYELCHPC